MSIERDEWLYVSADTAEQARKFFDVPADREVEQYSHQPGESPVWAVKPPRGFPIKRGGTMIQQLEALVEPIRRPPETRMVVQEVATSLILETQGGSRTVPLMQLMTLTEIHDYFTKRGKRPAFISLSEGVARVNW